MYNACLYHIFLFALIITKHIPQYHPPKKVSGALKNLSGSCVC